MNTSSQDMTAFFREVWSRLTVPVRPGPEGLDLYRRQIDRFAHKHVLVLGATPELVDMAVRLKAERVVSIERNPEIMAAMRQLGEEDWSGVQMIVADWLEQRHEFRAAFNCIVCDGGLLFLEFPGQWERLFELVHGYLAPGGVFVAKEWAEPAGNWDYEAMKLDLVAAFEQQCPRMNNGEAAQAFSHLVSEMRLAAFIDMTRKDGSFAQEPLVARLDRLIEEFEERFPDPEQIAMTHAALKYLARSRPGTTDTVAGVRYDGAQRLPSRQGFQCREFPLPDAPVRGGNYMFVACK
jgi:SAM-dependent methyltransferase